MRRTTGLTFLLWLSAGGCGSSLAPDPTIVPLGNWASEVAAAQCANVFGCCDSAELQYWGYADEADCRRKVTDQQSAVAQIVKQGLRVYDGKAARRCLDEMQGLSCVVVFGDSDLGSVAPSCALVTRGAGQLGAPCEDLDLACESANCLPSSGTCGPPRACPAACDAGQYCDEAAGGCTAATPEGGPCWSSLQCSPSVCYAGSCSPRQPDGTVCLADDDCLSGSCIRALDGYGACGATLPDGSACYSDSACTSGTCARRSASGGATCGPLFCDGV